MSHTSCLDLDDFFINGNVLSSLALFFLAALLVFLTLLTGAVTSLVISNFGWRQN